MSATATAANPLKILVVDADRSFHEVVSEAVRSLPDAQIVCATNPGEALHRLTEFLPTLIVVDGQLNGAAGINFVKRVRTKQTPAPEGTLVLFVAKEFTGGLGGRLCDAGCHGVVRKPVSAKALGAAIGRVLAKPVPFVLGGSYLGPDRRAEGATAGRDPDRRRAQSRGGWTGTPPLFYRPSPKAAAVAQPSRPPAWKKAPAAAPPRPSLKPAAPAAALASARAATPLVDDEAPAADARMSLEPLVAAAPAARPKVRDIEDADAAAPIPEAAPAFDLAAVVEQHRQWIASNGTAGARANLAGLALENAMLSGKNLAKANLRGANLMNADLRLCILVDADLRNACLAQANLGQAELASAKVRHADLQFAQLAEARLQGSDLAGADLRGAVLAGADLSGANLLGANICGADLTAINLTQKQLDRALGDAKTVLPPGLFVARADG